MKRIVAAALLLCLLVSTSAQASPWVFNLTSPMYPGERVEVSLDYALLNPNSSMATLTVLNAMAAPQGLVSLAVNLPLDGAGITSVSLVGSSNPNFHLLGQASPYSPNSIFVPAASKYFDVGLDVGLTFGSGISSPGLGILNGQLATFSLLFNGSGPLFSITDAQGLKAMMDNGPGGTMFAQGAYLNGGAPTPVPAAVWLLGSGLAAGLMGLKRRRKAA